MHDHIASLLGTLIAFRSVDGEHEEKQKIAAFAADWLEAKGIPVEFHPHAAAPSLVVNLPGNGEPLLFLAHLDVVPAPDHMFTMLREGNRCFGRGVIDDKGPAAILLLLLAELMTWQQRPAVRAVFATDEEIGSRDGVIRLLEMKKLTPARAVIALDGGSEDTVVIREKGVCHFLLIAKGTSVHNSRPWEGDNAVEKIWRVYDRIKKALAVADTSDPLHWHETVSIGMIEGGEFVNQVPDHAVAKIDIRFTEHYSSKSMRELLDAQLEDGVTIEGIGTGECFKTDASHPLLASYMAAMGKQGMNMTTCSEHGATDARFFAAQNVPIWIHDPIGGGLHTDSEWLDLSSAARVLEGLKEFCKTIV